MESVSRQVRTLKPTGDVASGVASGYRDGGAGSKAGAVSFGRQRCARLRMIERMDHSKRQERFVRMLERFGLSEEEIARIVGAASRLRPHVPRLTEAEIEQVVKRVSSEFSKQLTRHRPLPERSSLRKEIRKWAADIALGIVGAGVWELLVYAWVHIVLHAASVEEDWEAQDAARAARFRPTQGLSVEDQHELRNSQLLLHEWRAIYLRELRDEVKSDPTLKAIADRWVTDVGTSPDAIDTFFFGDLVSRVYAGLTSIGAERSSA